MIHGRYDVCGPLGPPGPCTGPGRAASSSLWMTPVTAEAAGNSWRNTLLIITHDEHGGCYDHIAPPTGVTPPDLSGYTKWDDFDFTRLGVRVPMVMVSAHIAHIAHNTVINTPTTTPRFSRPCSRSGTPTSPVH
ncbi:MAG: alkaline phosphatase family protein [Pseudonocardiaceae bacterium]